MTERDEAFRDGSEPTPNQDMAERLQRSAGALLLDMLGEPPAAGYRAEHVEPIRQLTEEAARNPYQRKVFELFTGTGNELSTYADLVSFYRLAKREVSDRANQLTDGGMGRLAELEEKIISDHRAVIEAVESGRMTLEEIGITEEDYRTQKAHAAWPYQDINEIYTFMHERETHARKELAKQRKRETLETKDKAMEQGALMSLSGHVTAPSSQRLQDAFTNSCIMQLPESISVNKENLFDKQTGKLNLVMMEGEQLEQLEDLNPAFFAFILRSVALSSDADQTSSNNISFYLPGVLDDLKMDVRGFSTKRTELDMPIEERYLDKAMELILPYDRYIGRTPDGSYYRVLAFEGYHRPSQTITLSVPYLYELKRLADESGPKHPELHSYFHSSIGNEPNSAAVELAFRIAAGILRRGSKVYGDKPSNIVPYEVSYQTLIAECPQVAAALDEIMASNRKNKLQLYNSKLRNIFETAFRIIEEKTDFPTIYRDFKLPKKKGKTLSHKKDPKTGKYTTEIKETYIVPTRSKLSQKLRITHRGRA